MIDTQIVAHSWEGRYRAIRQCMSDTVTHRPAATGIGFNPILLFVRSDEGLFLTGILQETTLHPLDTSRLACEGLTDDIGYRHAYHFARSGTFTAIFARYETSQLNGWTLPACMLFNLITVDTIKDKRRISFDLVSTHQIIEPEMFDMEK